MSTSTPLTFDDNDAVKVKKAPPASGTMSAMQRKSAAKKNAKYKPLPKPQERNARSALASDKDSKSLNDDADSDEEQFDGEIDTAESNRLSDDEPEEGEAAWDADRLAYEQKERNLAAARGQVDTPPPSLLSLGTLRGLPRPSLWTFVTMLLATAAIAGLCYLRFNDGLEMSDRETLETAPPDVDYYVTMGVDRTASLSEINRAYRKLALQLHPDKAGPDCVDCAMRFDQLSTAYKTLSNKQKRAMYDAVETSFSELRSKTQDLHSDDFQLTVMRSAHVWFVQIYTDWHRSAIRFAPVWEEVSHSHRNKARFGRIHLATERKLVHKLPVSVRQVPTVLCIVDGIVVKSRTFLGDTRENFKALRAFIDDEFPTEELHVIQSKVADVQSFLVAEPHMTSVLLFPSSKSKAKPSLSYRAISRRFSSSFRFGQVHMPRLDTKPFMTEIKKEFGRFHQTQLPIVLVRSPNATLAQSFWLSGDMSGDALLSHMFSLQRRQLVSNVDSAFWNLHCTAEQERHTLCAMLLLCSDSASAQAAPVRAELSAAHSKIIARSSPDAVSQYQFGVIDTQRAVDIHDMCHQLAQQGVKTDVPVLVGTFDDGESIAAKEIDAKTNARTAVIQFVQDLKDDTSSLQKLAPIRLAVHRQHKGVFRLAVPGAAFRHLYFDLPIHWVYTAAVLSALWLARNTIANHLVTFSILVFASTFILPLLSFVESTGLKSKLGL